MTKTKSQKARAAAAAMEGSEEKVTTDVPRIRRLEEGKKRVVCSQRDYEYLLIVELKERIIELEKNQKLLDQKLQLENEWFIQQRVDMALFQVKSLEERCEFRFKIMMEQMGSVRAYRRQVMFTSDEDEFSKSARKEEDRYYLFIT